MAWLGDALNNNRHLAMVSSLFERLATLLGILIISSQAVASLSPASPLSTSTLSFVTEIESDYDRQLIAKLEKYSVFERLRRFSEQDLQLKQAVVYHFHQSANDQLDLSQSTVSSSLDAALNIPIPFSYLYQLDQGLIAKYPEQPDVQEAIYSAAVEKFLWFELGRAIMQQFELGFSGQEVFALDNFSTIMLINLSQQEHDYILDATEAFLLIDQSIPQVDGTTYNEEVSLDDERYRKAVCLILGKDYLSHLSQTGEPYQQLLEELAWDQEKIEKCQKLYLEKLRNWLNALAPHLKENNRLSNWLAAY